uniref:uncharacterized protein LOC113474226 isoform X2 n=1 Tax=Ciona intestinalis TaxID=7719 RepID=UPI000EF4681C|nr:uncharacterized protein LOC113474226 isoform X2 [Ciona intestinalis]|eukprot:XP_026690252.1 uncharacterized protein LOC113474226 isoform X2 [Ciona intestinalis]
MFDFPATAAAPSFEALRTQGCKPGQARIKPAGRYQCGVCPKSYKYSEEKYACIPCQDNFETPGAGIYYWCTERGGGPIPKTTTREIPPTTAPTPTTQTSTTLYSSAVSTTTATQSTYISNTATDTSAMYPTFTQTLATIADITTILTFFVLAFAIYFFYKRIYLVRWCNQGYAPVATNTNGGTANGNGVHHTDVSNGGHGVNSNNGGHGVNSSNGGQHGVNSSNGGQHGVDSSNGGHGVNSGEAHGGDENKLEEGETTTLISDPTANGNGVH